MRVSCCHSCRLSLPSSVRLHLLVDLKLLAWTRPCKVRGIRKFWSSQPAVFIMVHADNSLVASRVENALGLVP